MNDDDQSHEQNTSKNVPTTLQNPSLVVNSMLTALAQSLLPSSTDQQQFLADLQAAATLVNKQKISSTSDNNNSIEFNCHIKTSPTDNEDVVPQITQAKRRATHNAVERRRRDRINQHIQQLSKLIPDCSNYVKNQSKTVVLEKTIAHLHELRTQNLALVKQTVDAGIILHENDLLRERIRAVEQENEVLKSLLTKQNLLNGSESSLS
ncbi:unnamed protein product [Rotaria socialis]|uniref:BHLH domain-containing protein n=4 Tax=Rotaria socialis TaxID=392032 RepID=A0A817PIV6_9BILA|nr:unnamed protein product [Rotaria socialis]CAF3275979.1 unnamed protein product [Rotaria socialis]CAF3492203.1 unnamed protein product [Rotaria socialis]CAF3680148.1 unnamed protein product [Rotaria socialis]CAF3751644.1 unnamed protein product [Rotaria socialis]